MGMWIFISVPGSSACALAVWVDAMRRRRARIRRCGNVLKVVIIILNK